MKKYLLLLAGIFLVGCSSKNTEPADDSAKSNEITISVDQELNTLDSALATDTYSITALNNVMEGLYRLNDENKIVPAGAAGLPTISEDQLTYTIQLRKEAQWSDQTPVTAQDYVFAWQKAVDSKTAAEYSYLFSGVKNADDILAGKKEPKELGIQATADDQLVITLEKPIPYFESLLAFTPFFPQPQKYVENHPKYGKSSEDLLFNGPFTLTGMKNLTADTEWSYIKNESYWDKDKVKLAKIDNIVIKEPATGAKMFESGELDFTPLTGELAKQYRDSDAFLSLDKAGTTYLSYNQTTDIFKNKKARQAMLLVLDRKKLVENVLADGSIEPKGLVPSGMSFNPENNQDFTADTKKLVKTDVKEAKKLWDEAKKETGQTKFDFNLVTYDLDSIRKVAENIQYTIEENLDGTKVNVNVVPVSVALEKGQSTDFDLFLFGWGADYADPTTFLDLFKTNSPSNYGKFNNPTFDQLMEKAATTDVAIPEKRWKDMVEAENLLMEEAGVNPIFQKAEARLKNPQLKGIVAHSVGAQFDFKEAYLESK